MEISEAGIKGLGPKKVAELQRTGILTVKDLAEIDLRTSPRVDGVSRENLKVLKQRARIVCRREGIAYEPASYSTSKGGLKGTPKKPKTGAEAGVVPARKEKGKGLFARLLGK